MNKSLPEEILSKLQLSSQEIGHKLQDDVYISQQINKAFLAYQTACLRPLGRSDSTGKEEVRTNIVPVASLFGPSGV